MRITKKIQITDVPKFKKNLLAWAQQFEEIAWLDSNDYPQKYTHFSTVLALGAETDLSSDYKNAFQKLKRYKNGIKDYMFGYLGYDLKNDIEALSSNNPDHLHFPDLYFFQPKKLFIISENVLEIKYLNRYENEIETDLKNILKSDEQLETLHSDNHRESKGHDVKIHKRIAKDNYLEKIEVILEHIHRGDIYEMNFCQEFYSANATINPHKVYHHLNAISKPPFATFLRINDKYLLSASPERFVKRESQKIITQPIKGTAKRLSNKARDKELAVALKNDPKERAENIMIVDLVRNDLSKTAIKGSVQVEELCKVYSFKQVHQLISTVTSRIDAATDSIDVIKSLFPMGSMTGAPKISAMKIIEETEAMKRGLYSGAVGYFTPEGDFDFNVVIRSILYNGSNKYLSYSVGGAITAQSDPEKEYEECLLKAIAMKKALIN